MLINRALKANAIVEQEDEDGPNVASMDLSIEAYRQFLRDKVVMSKDLGFKIEPGQVNPILKPHTVRRRGCPDDYRTA